MAARRDDPLRSSVADYRPLALRRRLLIVPLAVATAIAVVLLLLYPPGGVQRTRPKAPGKIACVDGRPPSCAEDKAGVVVVMPVAAPASGPSAAASR